MNKKIIFERLLGNDEYYGVVWSLLDFGGKLAIFVAIMYAFATGYLDDIPKICEDIGYILPL